MTPEVHKHIVYSVSSRCKIDTDYGSLLQSSLVVRDLHTNYDTKTTSLYMWAFVKYSGKGLVWTTNDSNTVALGFIVILEHHGAGIRVLARAISIYCISDVVTIGQEWHVWLAWGADVYGSSGSGTTPEEPCLNDVL